ncbi:helix-turn-helix protein [Flavobacterium croceum DSM 17960]|uniref:Helix-turn-helix protein n=1 Tax=Flavobacterium croceum DSM 17960 TaxID=1121886 RepID=A0A2S4N7Y6_9FLAO|nr:helix-turn-helix protein [Flavobacterium croceum DSM 17960]
MRKEVDVLSIKKFGKKLRQIRVSKGISMELLASLTSFEYSQISRIELGQINTSIDAVFKLAKALNIEPKELFDFEK